MPKTHLFDLGLGAWDRQTYGRTIGRTDGRTDGRTAVSLDVPTPSMAGVA